MWLFVYTLKRTVCKIYTDFDEQYKKKNSKISINFLPLCDQIKILGNKLVNFENGGVIRKKNN